MTHHWGPPQHRRNRFDSDRRITAWECQTCGTAILVDGWRADMPCHWKQRQSPCPPQPPCPHWHSIDIGTSEDDLHTIAVRQCLDCGCVYRAMQRKHSEWHSLPIPSDADYSGSALVQVFDCTPAPPKEKE